jgi:hypothetical protein
MIYLIDDNQNNQREKLGANFVDNRVFAGFLTSVERIEKRAPSDISHLDFLSDARCILLHTTTEDWDTEKGFLSGSCFNVRKIKEDIADFGDKIPLVLFSNSMGEPVYENNCIREIKKNLLYERLYDFVEHYKNTDEIELRILAWGKHFQAKEIASLANILLESVAFLDGTEKFEMNFLLSNQPVFQKFIKKSFPNNADEVFKHLEQNQISVSEFRNKINTIAISFKNYGKNIYPW